MIQVLIGILLVGVGSLLILIRKPNKDEIEWRDERIEILNKIIDRKDSSLKKKDELIEGYKRLHEKCSEQNVKQSDDYNAIIDKYKRIIYDHINNFKHNRTSPNLFIYEVVPGGLAYMVSFNVDENKMTTFKGTGGIHSTDWVVVSEIILQQKEFARE